MKKMHAVILFFAISFATLGVWAQTDAPAQEKIDTAAPAETSRPDSQMAAKKETNSGSADFYAIGIIMALAVLGGAIGQGMVGSAAMAGVARNPGAKSAVQTLMILTLVLIESLVIYALVVSLLLYAKL
jgi:F-type H+-transporting ATPase subunit c